MVQRIEKVAWENTGPRGEPREKEDETRDGREILRKVVREN